MQPVSALVFGVMSKVGSRAARSRTSWTISSCDAEVPMASGQIRCPPPLVERSVMMTPPHSVSHDAAVAMSAATPAAPWRLASKSSHNSWVRRWEYR